VVGRWPTLAAVVTLYQIRARRSAVLRLIIAIVLGLAIALGGTVLVTHLLSSPASNTPAPSSSSVDNYGNR
jgi:hypothetical protein